MVVRSIFTLLLAYVLLSCKEKHDALQTALLHRADSLIEARPDSALHLIKEVNSRMLSKPDRARYALLFTKARYKNYLEIENDSLINIAVEYYSGSKEAEQYGEALMYKGCALFDMMDYNGAMEQYKQAEDIYKKTGNRQLLGLIYTRIAEIHKQIYSDDSIIVSYYHLAISYFKMAEDKKNLNAIYSMLGSGYIFSLQKDSAEYYLKKSLEITISLKDDRTAAQNYYLLMTLYNSMERYEQAKRTGLYAVNEGCNNANIQYQLCLAYAGLKQIDSAKYIYNQHSNNIPKLRKSIALMKIYAVTGNYKEALYYNQKATLIADSIVNVQKKQNVLAIEKRFDYNKILIQKQRIEYENRMHLYSGTIVFLGCICIIVTLVVLNMRKKRKLGEYFLFIEQLRIDKQMVHETLINRLSHEDVAELQLKEALGRRLGIVDEVSDILYQFGDTESASACNAKLRAVAERYKLDSKLQDDICIMVNKKYNGILDLLQREHPGLGREDLRFLCFICGGFSYTTIAFVLQFVQFGQIVHPQAPVGQKNGAGCSAGKIPRRTDSEAGYFSLIPKVYSESMS